MTETQGEVRIRNVRTQRSDSFMISAMEFGAGIVRLGFSVFTLPLALLPPESRDHMRNATRELMYGFASLPRDFAEIAGESIEDWAREADDVPLGREVNRQATAVAPRDEMSPDPSAPNP